MVRRQVDERAGGQAGWLDDDWSRAGGALVCAAIGVGGWALANRRSRSEARRRQAIDEIFANLDPASFSGDDAIDSLFPEQPQPRLLAA